MGMSRPLEAAPSGSSHHHSLSRGSGRSLGSDFTQGRVGRCSGRPTPVVGEMDNPFLDLHHGEITGIKRRAKVIPEGSC
jgi:hypothetical protein